MIKRLLYVIGIILYIEIVLAPFFFPYLILKGWDKTEDDLIDPLHYLIDKLDD